MAFCECSLAPIPDLVDFVDLDGSEPFVPTAQLQGPTYFTFVEPRSFTTMTLGQLVDISCNAFPIPYTVQGSEMTGL